MKNYLNLAMVALIGLFASCINDDQIGGEAGGQLTTITVDSPLQGAMTRAGSDAFTDPALTDMRVALIISTADNNVITVETKTHSFGNGSSNPCTFEARLYKGKTYNISVWADYGAAYYTIPTQPTTTIEAESTLPIVKMASTTITGSDNKYDAYFGNTTTSLSDNGNINVQLSRPFALVKVNTTDWDENAVKLASYRPDNYATTFKAPTQLNLVSGEADETKDISVSAGIVEYDQDGATKELQYDYLFANVTSSILPDFTVDYKQGTTKNSDYTFENIPVQRNYKTDIKGNILTKKGKISVTLSPIWNGTTDVVLVDVQNTTDVVNALQQAQNDNPTAKSLGVNVKGESAAASGTERPIEIPATFTQISGTNVTPIVKETIINLEGGVKPNETIVIRDEFNHDADPTLDNQTNITTYPGVIYISAKDAEASNFDIQTPAATVYLNGTKIKDAVAQTAQNTFVVDAESEITGVLTVKKGHVAIYGKVNSIKRSPDNTDAVTYVDIYEGGVWTNEETEKSSVLVPRHPVASIFDTPFMTLADAIDAVNDGETIVMASNVTLTDKLVISNGKTFTFDLNGKTLTGRVNVSGAKVTIQNGTIDAGTFSQALNAYGTSDPAYAEQVVTYIRVAEDVTLKGKYGMCFLTTLSNSYFPYCYGVKVDFYGKSLCASPAYVSGNIGNDQQDYGDVSAFAPAGINSRSKAMFLYGPEFNIYGELTSTDSSDENPQGLSLSGMIRVNVYQGAQITGGEGIGMKSGNLHVYGGTIKSVGAKEDPVMAVNSGTEASGAAISITSYYTNDVYADRANMSVSIEGGDISAVNNSALLVTHSYEGGQSVAMKQGVDLSISNGSFSSGADVPVVFIDNAAAGDAFAMPSKFIMGGTFNKEPNADYIAKNYEAIEDGDKWNVQMSSYSQLAEVIENTPVGSRMSIYGESFKKAADGFCYKDAANKTGRLVYLTVVSPGKDGVNASVKVSTDPTATPRTIQNLFLGSENRLNAPGTLLKNGDIVVLPNETLFIEDQSTIYDMYGDITWLGEPNGKSVIKPWQSAGSKNYRFFRIYNRYKKTVEDNVIYHYNFKNVVFDGSLEKNAGANLFVVTCYNIQMNMENCVVKNFPGSVFSIWANDTYDNAQAQTPDEYPTKADNVGVEVNLTGTICQGNGRLVHYDCSPYQVRDIDAGKDRYAFIHVNYDNTCTIDNTEMYSVNANTARGQGNCLLNGVDIWPTE